MTREALRPLGAAVSCPNPDTTVACLDFSLCYTLRTWNIMIFLFMDCYRLLCLILLSHSILSHLSADSSTVLALLQQWPSDQRLLLACLPQQCVFFASATRPPFTCEATFLSRFDRWRCTERSPRSPGSIATYSGIMWSDAPESSSIMEMLAKVDRCLSSHMQNERLIVISNGVENVLASSELNVLHLELLDIFL